jgi:hypothetical protein
MEETSTWGVNGFPDNGPAVGGEVAVAETMRRITGRDRPSGAFVGGEPLPSTYARMATDYADATSGETQFRPLRRELDAAYAQASMGKGQERHGGSEAFEDQPGVRDAIALGPAGPVYQARKKLLEGCRMYEAGNVAGALREWHGAIVYTAMACIAGRRK